MFSIKQGASFRLAIDFETQDEWNALFPADYAISRIRFGEQYFDLETIIDSLTNTVYLKANTFDWPIEDGELDVKVINGDLISALPEINNIKIRVIDGVT